MIKSDKQLTSLIKQSIQENCDCEFVEKNISTGGTEAGISNQTASCLLKKYKYKGSAIQESHRINMVLKAS